MRFCTGNASLNFRAILTLILGGVAGAVHGNQLANERYPWDGRPDKCLMEPEAGKPECSLDNWPGFAETVDRVIYLYKQDSFALLERALTELGNSTNTFSSGNSHASAAYWAFRTQLSAPGAGAADEARIMRWRQAVPDSYFVVFAEARYLYASAWNARGSTFADGVSPESWDLFAQRLRDAEKKLLDAPQALKDTPLWHNLLLAIAQDSRNVQSKPLQVFENAVKKWPRHFDFYEVMLTRLVPRWGGSWELVEGFNRYWRQQLAATEGQSMYARLYISLLGQGVSPGDTLMDWEMMKASFTDLLGRYPDPRFKNLYASFACYARDKNTFADAMRQLPQYELSPGDWISGHSHAACMKWTGKPAARP